ncbi:MAG: cation:proton antiporter, partial [Candidatus Nanopelagicales bacterium]|nr:cation:proton antiporter [Candidatus Nanopelagicales bacterium]
MSETDIIEIGGMVVFASIFAAILRNRKITPSLPLLVAGVILGLLPFGPDAPTDPEFVLIAILAPLVFGEALSSSIVDLRRVSRPVMALAVGLVVFGAFVVGVVMHVVVPGIPWAMAFALGAILAPTDAVAVSATAKSAGLPRRLVQILEGESLVNDGTALTLLRVASVAAAAGSVTVVDTGLILAHSVLGGLIVGVLAGIVLIFVIKRSQDVTVANGIVLLAPFPIYYFAETAEGSGILAVVVAALLVANATSSAVAYTGRLQAAYLWRTITFILQSAAFFLVGLEVTYVVTSIQNVSGWRLAALVAIITVALLAARFFFVFFMTVLSSTDSVRSRLWIVASWAGARGPISALAAFTLPLTQVDGDPLPYRSVVITITFCVVVVSLLLSLTIAPLARSLRLPADDDSDLLRRVRAQMARAALERLEEIEGAAERTGRPMTGDAVQRLRRAAERRVDMSARRVEEGEDTGVITSLNMLKQVSGQMIHAEQQELLRLRDDEGLPDGLMRTLQRELDV